MNAIHCGNNREFPFHSWNDFKFVEDWRMISVLKDHRHLNTSVN